ncbi:MAG: hypothetical protein ABJC05_07325 [Pyrinomonadaceae bacterium]
MLRKCLFILLLVVGLFSLGTLSAFAQTGQMRGHVVLQQAGGTKVPGADAVIDVYRTDIGGTFHTKTNKRGEWVFAGLPFVGTYTIAASMPNARPDFLPGAKAGRDVDYEMVLSPGDGKHLTFDEIKVATARNTGGTPSGDKGESAADKAKREELARRNAEIATENKKAENINETIGRTFKLGNEALNAKPPNYDQAIKQYEEGLAADADQPALLTNRAQAYKARGVDRFNAGLKAKDDAGMEAGKQDFRAASESATKAVELLKKEPAAADPAAKTKQDANKYVAFQTRAETMRLFVTKVDPLQGDAGLVAFQDYIAIETDPVKKARAQLDAAQMLLDAGQGEKSLAEFRKILATNPDDPDANVGAGLALFSIGDKAKYQEAANYLQHFVDVAPETHKFKSDAKAILAELKNTEKVEPVRSTPTRRGRRP